MGVLAFTTPDLGPTGKLVYAYVTYAVLMMVYTANNLPYSALSGVMSGDRAERTSISQYRFVFQTIGSFMIQVGALPMVFYLGRGDRALGYQHTMGSSRPRRGLLIIAPGPSPPAVPRNSFQGLAGVGNGARTETRMSADGASPRCDLAPPNRSESCPCLDSSERFG